jgi:hypothetical protein
MIPRESPPDPELRSQILDFLKDFKDLMGQGCYLVQNHLKNLEALGDLGINLRQRDETILSLSLENYSSGPTVDEYKPGYFWVFGKWLGEVEIYIKLKIVTFNHGKERAVCISFHRSEWALKYPLKTDSDNSRVKRK